MRVSNQGTGRQMGEMWTDWTNTWKGISIRLADGMGVWLKKRVVPGWNPKYQLVKLVAGAIFLFCFGQVKFKILPSLLHGNANWVDGYKCDAQGTAGAVTLEIMSIFMVFEGMTLDKLTHRKSVVNSGHSSGALNMQRSATRVKRSQEM